MPVETKPIFIDHEMYFAKSSANWNTGGVAFLKKDGGSTTKTFGKMYLITKEQFIDVLKQEINRNDLSIDFDKAITLKTYIFVERSWYGRIIHLGESDNVPIFTFTNEENPPSNRLSIEYIKTIAKGLKKTSAFIRRVDKIFYRSGGD